MTNTLHPVASIGHGAKTKHFAYYVGENITGTYCDRSAWERKRLTVHPDLTADDVTCTRCHKVAASPESVPNAGRIVRPNPSAANIGTAELAPELAPAGPSHNRELCSVKGCQL